MGPDVEDYGQFDHLKKSTEEFDLAYDLNVNHHVYVRLTETGLIELKRVGALIPEEINGWYKMQLHGVMSNLGHLMVMGAKELPFETNIKFVGEL